jgi:hypothetical protein
MQNKNRLIAISTLGILAFGGIGYLGYMVGRYNNADTNLPSSNQPEQNKFASSTAAIYENEYMKVTLLPGWVAQQAKRITYNQNCVSFKDCTTTPKVEPNPAAVNITKGDYILYINTQASQASGIEGGRFYEIAGGAPSVEAVVQDPGAGVTCFTSEETASISSEFLRKDLYESSAGHSDHGKYCNLPQMGTAWFFSYVTTEKGGYFNYYNPQRTQEGGPTSLVITMAYNSKDVNALPLKGSPALNSMLTEMTSIIKLLEVK